MEAEQVQEEGSPNGAMPRRGSMSDVEQKQRRASIQSIMTNPNLTPLEKRRSIQNLMDGRRASVDNGSNPANNPYLAYKASLLRAKLAAEEKDDDDDDDASMGNGEASSSDGGRRWGRSGDDGDDDEMTDADEGGPNGHPHDDAISPDGNNSRVDAPHPNSNKKKSHPYSAKTTAVPAIAASAYAGKAASDKKPKRRNSLDINKRAVETSPPCSHYRRNCHIVSPCCGATFGCRICHDDCPVLPPVFKTDGGEMMDGAVEGGGGEGGGRRKYQRVLRTSSMPTSFPSAAGPPEHHNIDRFAIREVICRQCFTKQGSKTNHCINCHVQFGEYHCAICNLWMSNEERPYHCPDCGFCRVGGGENFRHCQDCGMCIDKQLFDHHNCKVGKYMANCPVCYEDLFSSRDASHELPCGHAIHWHCFRELASHDSRCPICKKTAETHERMKPTWDAMAVGIALQPVPPELAKAVTIKCNDCEMVQENRSWHFLGVQCKGCESFNTVVERITMMGTEAHEFLLREDPPARVPHRRASVGAPPAGYRPPNRQN